MVYAIAITIFALFFYFFVPVIVNEVSGFLTTLPQYSSELTPEGLDTIDVSTQLSLEEIIGNIRSTLGTYSDNILGTIGVVFGGLFNFVLILGISFYLSIQKDSVAKFIVSVSPVKHTEYALKLWERAQKKISKWFKGMAISSFSVGLATYIGLLILGIPYAFFFALLSAFLDFVPIVGPIIAAIPIVAIGVVEGGLLIGVLALALTIFIQALEGNVLYPLIVGKAVGVSPIAIILAIGIGSKLGGFLGVLLAVPVAAVFVEFIVDIRKTRAEKKKKEDKEEDKGILDGKLLVRESSNS